MINLMRSRRSVRKFSEQPVEPEKVEILKEAVLRAPTSKNSQANEYLFIDEVELIQKLAGCKPSGAGPLQTATLAIVVITNESLTAAWIEDCSIAAFSVQLAAQSLGLGSCWIQVRGRQHSDEKDSEAFIRELFGIPEEFRILSVIAIGYPLREHAGHPFDELNFGKIHRNKF